MEAVRTMLYEFTSEAKEHLANVSDDLLALEKHQDDSVRYRVDRLFRAIHSVKGGAGFLGCRKIEELAHLMETLLGKMRQDQTEPDSARVDALLAGADRILSLLDDVERSEESDTSAICERLRRINEEDMPSLTADVSPATERKPKRARINVNKTVDITDEVLRKRPADHPFLFMLKIDLAERFRLHGEDTVAFTNKLASIGCVLDAHLEITADLNQDLSAKPVVYLALFSSKLVIDSVRKDLKLSESELDPVVLDEAREADVKCSEKVLEATPKERTRPVTIAPVEEPIREVETREQTDPATSVAASPAPADAAARGDRSNTVRINVNLLDRLMMLAGELVLVRNQALRAAPTGDSYQRQIVQRLNGVTSQLQEAIVLTRMQPVGNLFGKFPRLVRDLARQLDKEIELDISGNEVELDKTILEALSDPLTHLVRNCCDHGIEIPATRRKAGKPETGRIILRARHEAGQIHIEIRDDGKGIDPDRIRKKALQTGLRSEAELGRMSEKELYSLIILPGFSTAEKVTDLSGRGVGMDVVKTNLEHLGGSLEIESTFGAGTTIRLRLPLTLAIIPCLLVTVGPDRYAIPQKDLEELVCIHPGKSKHGIECAFDQEVFRLRGRLLPLVRMGEVFSRRKSFTAAVRAEILRKYHPVSRPDMGASENESAEAGVSFAVVKVGKDRFGLIVDGILSTEEIVVKPMHSTLKPLHSFSGATIMGDGRVALILNIEGIARHAGVVFETGATPIAQTVELDVVEKDRQSVLLFQCGENEQFAMSLAMIRRIEMIDPARIERVGNDEFMTIDDVSTQILRLDRYLAVSPCPIQPRMFLILPRNLRRPLAILTSKIIDTEKLTAELNTESYREDGILGSAVVRERMTLFPDVFRLADRVDAGRQVARPSRLPAAARRSVLLVEDTQFFRELVKSYLETAGFHVETANNGAQGLQALEEKEFDLVVSDIEMPVMNGWQFARAVRERWPDQDLPLLALTTLSSDADREHACACGFDRYEVKIDRESFLAAIADLVQGREKVSAGTVRIPGGRA